MPALLRVQHVCGPDRALPSVPERFHIVAADQVNMRRLVVLDGNSSNETQFPPPSPSFWTCDDQRGGTDALHYNTWSTAARLPPPNC